jgi:hypothetical protein
LDNVENWKAKIIRNNNPREGKKVGDWSTVGYVLINPESNFIVPVAREDEHHTGLDLAYALQQKNLIPKGKWFSIFGIEHDYLDSKNKVAAYEKWLELGGKDLAVITMGGEFQGLQYYGRMSDVVAKKGQIQIQKGVLNPLGRELVDDLEELAVIYKKLLSPLKRDEHVSLFKRKALALLNKLKSFVYMNLGVSSSFLKKSIESIQTSTETDFEQTAKILFGMSGLKNIIHMQIKKLVKKKQLDYSEMLFASYFGDLKTANLEFNRLAGI